MPTRIRTFSKQKVFKSLFTLESSPFPAEKASMGKTSSTLGYTKQSRKAAGMERAPETAMRLKFRALMAGSHRGFACDDLL